jgi:hypothetical protein
MSLTQLCNPCFPCTRFFMLDPETGTATNAEETNFPATEASVTSIVPTPMQLLRRVQWHVIPTVAALVAETFSLVIALGVTLCMTPAHLLVEALLTHVRVHGFTSAKYGQVANEDLMVIAWKLDSVREGVDILAWMWLILGAAMFPPTKWSVVGAVAVVCERALVLAVAAPPFARMHKKFAPKDVPIVVYVVCVVGVACVRAVVCMVCRQRFLRVFALKFGGHVQ